MHRFDSFSKPLSEFQVKTKTGGILSILTILLIFYLLVSELWFFLEVEQRDEMIVDLNQDTKELKMTLDIWVRIYWILLRIYWILLWVLTDLLDTSLGTLLWHFFGYTSLDKTSFLVLLFGSVLTDFCILTD